MRGEVAKEILYFVIRAIATGTNTTVSSDTRYWDKD